MDKLKRYNWGSSKMVRCKLGNWITFEDHLKITRTRTDTPLPTLRDAVEKLWDKGYEILEALRGDIGEDKFQTYNKEFNETYYTLCQKLLNKD